MDDLIKKRFNRKYYDPKRGDKIFAINDTFLICHGDGRPAMLLSSLDLPVDILVPDPHKYDTRLDALEIH